MEENQYIWLNLSVFYNRDNWQHLIANGIGPFYDTMYQQKFVDKILIYFNVEQGQNIRLSFRVTASTAEYFLGSADAFFKNFLKNNPSVDIEPEYPVKGFMADFPNNSIFYGLHQSATNLYVTGCGIHPHDFQYRFSKTIIEAFKDESFDDDSIFVFATYIIMGLAWGYENACNGPSSIKTIFETKSIETDFNISDQLSEQNKDGFTAIAEDIFNDHSVDKELQWLYEWKLFCRDEFEQAKTFPEDERIIIAKTLVDGLLRQLGIIDKNKALLLGMIEMVLPDFANL